MTTRRAVAVIPARGGSKGVPRKNLRTVDGMPLVGRTVMAAQQASNVGVIVVSSDDAEVLAVARHWGRDDPAVIVHQRPDALAGPDVTIAAAVDDALSNRDVGYEGEPVVVLQPSSPFTDATLIDACLDRLADCDSVATVTGRRGAAWTADGPLHSTPTNRQWADVNRWDETGAVVAVRSFPQTGGPLAGAPLVGRSHFLFDPADELGVDPAACARYALDVDDPADFAHARDLATRGRVLFVVTAGRRTGSGHVHRALTLADELTAHDVRFIFTDEADRWAVDLVKQRGYPVCTDVPRTADEFINADLVVLDCLDRARRWADEARTTRGCPAFAVFECLDPEVLAVADLIVNALYADAPGLTGPAWEPLRPEFTSPLHLALTPGAPPAEGRVIVTMGGTDPAHLTERFAHLAMHHGPGIDDHGMFVPDDARDVRVIWPPGRPDDCPENLVRWGGTVSEAFAWADVAVTSNGRSVLEAAAMRCATLAVCANDREVTHRTLDGVMVLGHHATVTDAGFQHALSWLLDDDDERTRRSMAAARQVDPAAATVTLGGMLDDLARRGAAR